MASTTNRYILTKTRTGTIGEPVPIRFDETSKPTGFYKLLEQR